MAFFSVSLSSAAQPPLSSPSTITSRLTFRKRSVISPPTSIRSKPFTASTLFTNRGRKSQIVGMAPDEEKMTRRSPLDFPIEWDRPKPGRRPDIFPQFSPMKTPLPLPLPADPPEEDEEDEEKKEEQEEDPEQEETEKPNK